MTVNVDETIVTTLKLATGKNVYPVRKPIAEALPCVVYKRVSMKEHINQSGKSGIVVYRYQITCYADTYSGWKTIFDAVNNDLVVNTSDFKVCIPSETCIQDKDGSVYFSIRDYLIYIKE